MISGFRLSRPPQPHEPLIVVATESEAACLDTTAPVVVSGVGRLHAAAALTEVLARHPHPSMIINIGTAGALTDIHGIHSISQVMLHDFSHEALAAITGNTPYPPIHLADEGVPLCTGDMFVDSVDIARKLAQQADLVDMEGYAIAWVAQRWNIPCRLLKIVSDQANEDSRKLWVEAVRQCSAQLGEWLAQEVPAARPKWAQSDPLLAHYYDTEWGFPVKDERGIFERISLEAFQSGLSWATILKKRPAFREAFANFDPEVVAGFGEAAISELMNNPGIIRNRAKIRATIHNAKATLRLREQGGLAQLVWSVQPDQTERPASHTPYSEIPTQTPESEALAQKLRDAGFQFIGPTTMFALMQAIGIVNYRL